MLVERAAAPLVSHANPEQAGCDRSGCKGLGLAGTERRSAGRLRQATERPARIRRYSTNQRRWIMSLGRDPRIFDNPKWMFFEAEFLSRWRPNSLC